MSSSEIGLPDTADTSSITGSTSGSSKRIVHKFGKNDRVMSNWEFIIISVTFLMQLQVFQYFPLVKLYNDELDDVPNILQYVIVFSFVGIPMVYMQVFIGQYSELTVLYYRYMCPLGRGIGYVVMLILMLNCGNCGVNLGDILMYFLTSLHPSLFWLKCSKKYKDICWAPNSSCKTNCFNSTIIPSATIYFNYVYKQNSLSDSIKMSYRRNFKRLSPMGISWVVVFLGMFLLSAKLIKVTKYVFCIFLFCFLLVTLTLVATTGIVKATAPLFEINYEEFYSFEAWFSCISLVTIRVCIGRGVFVLFGSYLPSTAHSGILVVTVIFLHFIMKLITGSLLFSALHIIAAEAGLPLYNATIHYDRSISLVFTLVPQALGYQAVPHVLTIVHFLAFFLLTTNNQLMHIKIIEICITDFHPGLLKYKSYIFAILTIIGFLLGIAALIGGIHSYIMEPKLGSLHLAEMFVIILYAVCTFWIYGVTRLCDDIYFFKGQQPTKFWKVSWLFIPLVLTVTEVVDNYGSKGSKLFTEIHPEKNNIYRFIVFLVFISPIPIFAAIETFKYIKGSNIFGVLEPTIIWGPTNPEERSNRLIFNPRRETKSCRRNEQCNHKCLLGSKRLKKIVAEEIKLRAVTLAEAKPEDIEASIEDIIYL